MRWPRRSARRRERWAVTRAVARPRPLPRFALFAMIPAFHEADVIGATVAHARAQGCDEVYVVDDGSADGTADVARAAGATVEEHRSPVWDDGALRRRMHEWARTTTADRGHEHTWWLFLDADEFPRGRGGLRVREYLERLDRRYRIVGAHFYNHLPTGSPQYVPGLHPAEFQPLCYARRGHACRAGHFKHPLVRFDRGGKELRAGMGAHLVKGAAPLIEPPDGILVQHFQFRDEATTRRRLELVAPRLLDDAGRIARANASVAHRAAQLDAIYRGDWANVIEDGTRQLGVSPVPFADLVDPADAAVPRWYTAADVATALTAGSPRTTEPH